MNSMRSGSSSTEAFSSRRKAMIALEGQLGTRLWLHVGAHPLAHQRVGHGYDRHDAATSGCRSMSLSMTVALMLSPPRLIISLMRPVMVT